MRAGFNTIMQTLTPDVVSVLNHSIADAGRRGHSQTTPLHVAATLLSWPTGFLRQACIRSHPNSSHPLQCRALELCFTVALERLPTSGSALSTPVLAEPPISNALMAALKRAQAHQRRGCPEQQQQPLLAVKVELEQLVISILDDPSVSRVMKEAGFSSTAVKATIEHTISDSSSNLHRAGHPTVTALSAIPSRNSYMNPRLQITATTGGGWRVVELKKVVEILQREKKRNPVLVGDHEPVVVVEELLRKLEKKEFGEGFSGVQVVSVEKELAAMCEERSGRIDLKIKELGLLIESKVSSGGGVILNLGDLRWLIDQGGRTGFGVSESGLTQAVVSEMGKLLESSDLGGKVWLMGTATCETYLRCQVYHPSMESDWDLQAVPIAARFPLPGMFSRIGGNGTRSMGSLFPQKPFQENPLTYGKLAENGDPASSLRITCCPSCMENYEKELAQYVADELDISLSDTRPDDEQQQRLPQWLQQVKSPGNRVADQTLPKDDQEQVRKEKTEELQRKWSETCSRLHAGFHPLNRLSKLTSLTFTPLLNSQFSGNGSLNGHDPHSAWRQQWQPKSQLTRNTNLQPGATNTSVNLSMEPPRSLSGSPVRTDLVLGRPNLSPMKNTVMEVHADRTKDLTSWTRAQPMSGAQFDLKSSCGLDEESFKKLFKGLAQEVNWQTDAATMVATAVTKCRSHEGKQITTRLKGDTWLLFLGADRVGKKKMAMGLAELVFGNRPTRINLGQSGHPHDEEDDECSARLRGRTLLDRIADAVRRNPFSVVVLEDVDHTDNVIHSSLIQAMETGRLPDSHGREVSLGNVFLILTAEWLPESFMGKSSEAIRINETKLAAAAASFRPMQLRISSRTNNMSLVTNKRRPAWLEEGEVRSAALPKPRLAIDLNLSADNDDVSDASHGSQNSSDLTIETTLRPRPAAMKDFADQVDEAIIFKPVDFDSMLKKISSSLRAKFSSQVGNLAFEVEEEVLEQLLGAVWFGQGSGGLDEVDEWADRVLVPVFRELDGSSPMDGNTMIARLVVSDEDAVAHRPASGNFLPSKIPVRYLTGA